MRGIYSFLLILFFSAAGEGLHAFLPLPIPASVYGLCLLFLALCLKIVRVEQVRLASRFLLEIMPILFIPAAVGVLEIWPAISPVLLPLLAVVLLTTVSVLGVSGRVTQALLVRGEKHE